MTATVPETAAALQEWFLARTGTRDLGRVELTATDDAGLGLAAKCAVAEGETLFHVPRPLLLSCSGRLPAEIKAELARLFPDMMENDSLALTVTLLYECALAESASTDDPLSSWAPYVRALPKTSESLIFADFEILGPLASLPAFAAARSVSDALDSAFTNPAAHGESLGEALARLLPLAATPADLAALRARFRWAYAMVESRAFKPIPTDRATTVLVPFGDLLNHSSLPANVNVRYRWARNGVEFYAARAVAAGAPLIMKYNDLSNADELLYYGFCERDNPLEAIEVTLPEPTGAKLLVSMKRALLINGPVANLALTHSLTRDCRDAANVLLSLRVLHATTADLAKLKVRLNRAGAVDVSALDLQPVVFGLGEANDKEAYAAMAELARSLRAMFAVPDESIPSEAARIYVQELAAIVDAFVEYFDLKL
ncbi:hypothetical protein H9P43_001297 [Blastocladiella emersonii ATCC 22665]|nr:hypothetical protein H9P43_001297 [Blastocladiella emersonii ATCC 22665]